MMAMLVGALLPTITQMGRKHAREESTSPRVRRHHYSTPPCHRLPSTEVSSVQDPPLSVSPATSSASPSGSDIEACLDALLAREGLDLTPFISILTEFDLTPDVIPHADTSFLIEILGITVGKALKFKIFCEGWSTRRNGKKRASDF